MKSATQEVDYHQPGANYCRARRIYPESHMRSYSISGIVCWDPLFRPSILNAGSSFFQLTYFCSSLKRGFPTQIKEQQIGIAFCSVSHGLCNNYRKSSFTFSPLTNPPGPL